LNVGDTIILNFLGLPAIFYISKATIGNLARKWMKLKNKNTSIKNKKHPV